jgi:hypothetical protein
MLPEGRTVWIILLVVALVGLTVMSHQHALYLDVRRNSGG